jgi:GTP pyrophosphokinase
MDPDLAANHDMALSRLLTYYDMTQPNELYAQVGQGAIWLNNIHDIVFPKRDWRSYIPFIGKKDKNDAGTPKPDLSDQTPDDSNPNPNKPKKKEPHAIVLTDENLGKQYILSNCCHPIPGDNLLGYLDDSGKMHIHKIDCPEANLLKTSYGKRIYSATWNTHRIQSFVETIELKGIDEFGVFIRLLQTITTDFHINIRAVNVTSDDGIFKGTMEVYVYDRSELDDLLKAISKLDNIKEVKRVNIE